jgi:hypothetical protein
MLIKFMIMMKLQRAKAITVKVIPLSPISLCHEKCRQDLDKDNRLSAWF